MTENQNINVRKYLIIIIIGIPLFIYVFVFGNNQKKLFRQLEKEGIVDTAMIVRDFIGAKNKQYFEYQFIVDNEMKNGFIRYSPSHGDLKVGDSVLIKYLPNNPDDINEILQKTNKELIKIE